MAAVMTIGGSPVIFIEDTLDVQKQLDERQRLQCDVFDEDGSLNFQKGDQVTLIDPVIGTVFNGFINSDKAVTIYPTGGALHTIDCVDARYLADKRTFTKTYTTSTYAGKIVVDAIDSVLLDEGVQQNYAIRSETTADDFNEGTLSNTAGYSQVDDGDLELLRAGSSVEIIENTTSVFATGTLTNMTAASNSITPTTTSSLKLQTILSFAFGTEFAQAQQAATGTISGTASGSFSTGVNSSGSFSTGVNSSGSFSTGVNSSGSYTPSGSVNISGGAPGESASFNGFGSSINVSGTASASVNSSGTAAATVNSSGTAAATVNSPFSTSANLSINKQYQPKTKSKVKVDAKHYAVITVDRAVADNRVDAIIWTGTQVIGSSDVLNYDIWISSVSPSEEGGIDLFFSDGTQLTDYLGTAGVNNDVGIWDQNGVSVSPIQNLADYASDTWYTRQLNLSILSGKTVTSVSVFNAGNIAGTFDLFVKNVFLSSHSGSPFFSTSATAPSVNPPTVLSIGAYINNATIVTVNPAYDPEASSRLSPAYSIDAVKFIKDSTISWVSSNPLDGPAVVGGDTGQSNTASSMGIFVSYDATTWLPCTNNKPLPGLPAGANVNGVSFYLLETFMGGQDPTALPSLVKVDIVLNSAPNATTTDITSLFGTTATWNTGTELGTAPNSDGDLTLGLTSYTWSTLNNMTFVSGEIDDNDVTPPTQSIVSGRYTITSVGDADAATWSSSRFNFIAAATDCTIEGDFRLNANSVDQNEIGFLYRQTYWGTPNNSFAYYVRVMQNGSGTAGGTSITLGYGINSPPQSTSGAGTYTILQKVAETIANNTTYHVKIVVTGNRHRVYWNGSGTAAIDILDDTYTSPGNIGVRTYQNALNSNTSTASVANFSVTNTFAGIWTSPSINLNSLGTVGNTQISWAEINAAGKTQSTAVVSASLDGGTTWKQCTNGALISTTAIPGLSPGTSVVGVSLKIQIVISSSGFLDVPIIRGLYIRVCGAYPTVTGTRSTAPLGNDLMIRPNQSGWGTAFDTQVWAKAGTGTDTIDANKAVITNTTGDVHERLGTVTWNDEDTTIRFKLSNSSMIGGIELRYTDVNNYYRLAASTSAVSIIKQQLGTTFLLHTTSVSLTANTWYRMRFRVVGSTAGSTFLYGVLWLDNTLEPIVLNSNAWTITATE